MNSYVKKNIFLLIGFGIITLIALILLQFTKMEKIENVTELQVDFDSELLYTLSVSYDGIDRNGEKSTDGKIVQLDSEYIYVEDILPEGLEFVKFDFEGNDNIGIGSSKKDESSIGICKGHVINDSNGSTDPKSNHGLHYDESTRKVSFKIKNLSAGCKINVVIVTKTPSDIEGNRKDFYNTAYAWESSQSVSSNMVHAWIEKYQGITKKVTYEFVGNVPSGVVAPNTQEYAPGVIVGVAGDVHVEGYTFSGWNVVSPLDLRVTNNKFTMPQNDVVFQGSFTELPKYNVTYRIDGEGPDNYILPSSKQYYEGATVKVDNMKAGYIFNGYRFLGWTIDGIEISDDNDFIMPANDVEIVGKWERMKYKVTYAFYDGVRPPNYQEILDELNSRDNSYYAGEIVTLPIVNDIEPSESDIGYHFQGWYKDNNFEMPSEDIIVYGEWKIKRFPFAPIITKDIVNKKDYYKKGEIVSYNITVTNNENYEIRNVIVKEYNEDSQFIEDETNMYVIRSPHVVEISSIPANSSVTINASYVVKDTDVGTIYNTVEILGASADNNDFDTSDEAKENYKATESFDIWPELKISKIVSNEETTDKVFQFHITSEKGYDSWITLTNKESEIVYLEPNDTYSVKEIVPQEYTLEKVDGAFTYNGGSIEVELGDKLEVNFTNKHQNKGYYHSEGRVVNEVQSDDDKDENGDGIPDKYQVTVYYTSVNGYLYFGENVYPEDYSESLENQSVVLNKYDENGNLSKIGIARLTKKDIPGASPWLGYEEKEEWDTITPVPGLEVEDGDHFIITFDRITVPPSTIPEEYVTVYFEVINGYFYFKENVYPDDYQESYEISMNIPLYDENGNLSKNGKAYLTEDRIPKVAPLVGYNFKEEWDTITPVPGLEVEDGDRFVIEFVAGASLPSSGPPSFYGTEGTIKILWDDKGHEDERPPEIEFELYYEDELEFRESFVLSVRGDLFFEWTDLEYGSWSVVTRFLGESKNPGSCFYGYPYDIVGITMDGTNIIITFKYVGYSSVC